MSHINRAKSTTSSVKSDYAGGGKAMPSGIRKTRSKPKTAKSVSSSATSVATSASKDSHPYLNNREKMKIDRWNDTVPQKSTRPQNGPAEIDPVIQAYLQAKMSLFRTAGVANTERSASQDDRRCGATLLAVAHHFLDETINHLRISRAAPNYRLVIVSPSTHMYWNIGAPRALVRPELIENDNLFIPIEPGFHRHRGHDLSIIQGEAVALDPSARTVMVELIGSTAQKRVSQINKRASRVSVGPQGIQSQKVQTIAYHALIISTGSSAYSDLLSLHGPHLNTLGALNAFHAKLAVAKSIIVCGGSCSGVETAGQLATYLNYRTHWPFRKHVKHPKKIILITGTDACLPDTTLGAKAEKVLRSLGVEIRHNIRVIAAKQDFDLTSATKVELNDETSLIADMYIPCTGVEPNTAYVPPNLKDANRDILTNPSTLRCDETDAGPRVYAIGDCAAYSQNRIQDVYTAMPALMRNLLNDLLAHEHRLASPYGGNQDTIDELRDVMYRPQKMETALCPISRFGGVGIWKGKVLPKLLVHALKGHDYRMRKRIGVVEYGRNPYD